MSKIEELEEKIHTEICDLSEKFDKEISELKESEKQEDWVPQEEERYWLVDLDMMEVNSDTWYDDVGDDIRQKHKVVFKKREEAEEYLEYLKAKEKAMNEFSREEWEDEDIAKHYFYYDYKYKKFKKSCSYQCRLINDMHFRTEESAQEFINKYKRFLKRELGLVE